MTYTILLDSFYSAKRAYAEPNKNPSPQGGPFGWLCDNFSFFLTPLSITFTTPRDGCQEGAINW
jgi:hypothetical protein